MSLVSDVEQLSFGSLGFSRDYRHKIRPLNAERREICAVGSDLTVTSDPSPINTDPTHWHSTRNSLDFISPLPKLSLARRLLFVAVDFLAALLPEGSRRRLSRRRGSSSVPP